MCDDTTPRSCRRCGGTGTIKRAMEDDWGGVEYWYDARCPDCDGRGEQHSPHGEMQPLIDYMERDW